MKKQKTFTIMIKSHTEAPDFEAEVQADIFLEAQYKFYDMLNGDFDMDFIGEHMEEN